MYRSPGLADDLAHELLEAWNDTIQREYDTLAPDYGTRFFTLDPASIAQGDRVGIRWFADPAEPAFCLGSGKAGPLSDSGVKGRHELHNEYCEYAAVRTTDDTGRSRLKRVQVTTELREYWLLLAGIDPDLVCDLARSTLQHEVSLEELYGPGPSPATLDPDARRARFARLDGRRRQAAPTGREAEPRRGAVHDPPDQRARRPPLHRDVRRQALRRRRRRHPAAGQPRRDLPQVRRRGARLPTCGPGSRNGGRDRGVQRAARLPSQTPWACTCSRSPPRSSASTVQPVPESWVRWSRGSEGLWQRLEFGPTR